MELWVDVFGNLFCLIFIICPWSAEKSGPLGYCRNIHGQLQLSEESILETLLPKCVQINKLLSCSKCASEEKIANLSVAL